MQRTRIKLDSVELSDVELKRSLLDVTLKDKNNVIYKWTPRWDDLRRLFWLALYVETGNAYPKHSPSWEAKFANTARAVLCGIGTPETDVVRDLLSKSKTDNPELAKDPWSRTPYDCYKQIAAKCTTKNTA